MNNNRVAWFYYGKELRRCA